MTSSMTIQWPRVLLGGLLIEIILVVVLIGGFTAAGVDLSRNISLGSSVIIGVACFAAACLVAAWLGRGVVNRVVLHGVLMGVAATLLYLGLVIGGGQLSVALAAYGPFTFVILNGLRIVGAALGGVVCERRRALRGAAALPV